MNARDWLRENGYEDIASLIDEVMADLEARGSKQRRNWWDVLADGVNGRPLVVSGREIPVLQVAQRRQGKPLTQNAISRRIGNSICCGDAAGRRQGLSDSRRGRRDLGTGAYCGVLARSCVCRQSIRDSEAWAAPSLDARVTVNGTTDEWGALRPAGPIRGR